MSTLSVATHIHTALDPHMRNFMRSEYNAHHNQSLAPGCSMTTDDQTIEIMVHDLFADINAIIQRGHLVPITQPERY